VTTTDVLARLSRDLAAVVPRIDAEAEHERWQPGLGAFEEERQLKLLVEALGETSAWTLEREVPYPNGTQRCDLVVDAGTRRLPLEAKLLRFRRDNGDREPNAFGTVFDPFSNSLVADARKLVQSSFAHPGGLLGLYYERADEDTVGMDAQALAEKVCLDVEYWFDVDATTCAIEPFADLRHPVHQQGAVITWSLASVE
jgi:hypothetical protein